MDAVFGNPTGRGFDVPQIQTSPEQPDPQRPVVPSAERSVFVNLSIVAVAMLFIALVGIVWCYSWWRVPATPSALLVIEGNKDFDGTVITIDGPSLQSPRHEAIGPDASYVCRFPLPAGEYSIRIEQAGKLLYENSLFKISDHQYALLPLAKLQEQRSGNK
jgi:hypothetical protein